MSAWVWKPNAKWARLDVVAPEQHRAQTRAVARHASWREVAALDHANAAAAAQAERRSLHPRGIDPETELRRRMRLRARILQTLGLYRKSTAELEVVLAAVKTLDL